MVKIKKTDNGFRVVINVEGLPENAAPERVVRAAIRQAREGVRAGRGRTQRRIDRLNARKAKEKVMEVE